MAKGKDARGLADPPAQAPSGPPAPQPPLTLFGDQDASTTVAVLLPRPFDEPFDYLVPADIVVEPGSLVVVPLGSRETHGVVWGPGSGAVDVDKIKPIISVVPLPPLNEALRAFVEWVARYTLAERGSVLALALRARGLFEPAKTTRRVRLPEGVVQLPEGVKATPARLRLLQVAGDNLARPPAALAAEAGVSSGVIKGLVTAGVLVEEAYAPLEAFPEPDPERPAFADGRSLSPAQAEAAAAMVNCIRARLFAPILLDGVTGSGKTETYFEAVAETLRQGRQVLILLPEIALTTQTLARFEARFGCRPAEWHSDLTQIQRRFTWVAVAQGRASVVIGARSALFLPFPDLGLIVVDEEHDGSFKQEEGLTYNARDMAVVRARLAEATIVLASATPSLETRVNGETGRFMRVALPARAGGAQMPDMAVVDLRTTPPPAGQWLADETAEGVRAAIERGEQAMLFLNRRGYAPLTLCRACGHRMMSPDSASWLVEHRYTGRLVCHLTGFSMPKPRLCPSCGAEDSLVGCGPGVERIAEEAQDRFPEARIAVMSSDLLHTPQAAREVVEAMARREVDLLIGTQMVAKGHNFPFLTFVGVVDADMSLRGGDLRAGERTFQVLQQVAGRAGRGERPGRVLLQTYAPDHPVIEALVSGDRETFYARESFERELLGMPPFGRLAALILSGPVEADTAAAARHLRALAPVIEGLDVLGPAPAPYALVRGRFRFRMLVKATREKDVQAYLRAWLREVKLPGALRLSIDVDPYSFL